MYGFGKVLNVNAGVLEPQASTSAANETLEFRNDNFQRGQPDLLYLIHRKKSGAGHNPSPSLTALDDKALAPASATSGEGGVESSSLAVDLRTLLSEVAAIRKHQTTISHELKELSISNKQLWNEAVDSRSRHQKHQDTINKIVRFLGTVFGGKVLEQSSGGAADLAVPSPATSSAPSPAPSAAAAPVPRKKRLLIKGREDDKDYTGATIQEIELPSTEELDDLPVIGSSPLNNYFPTASTSSFPSTTPAADFLTPALPSPNSLAKLSHQDAQIASTAKDYSQLASQMDHLQSALDRIVATLPTNVATDLTQPALPVPSQAQQAQSQLPPDFDFDAFLQQFSNGGAAPTEPFTANAGAPDFNFSNWQSSIPEPVSSAPIDWSSLLAPSYEPTNTSIEPFSNGLDAPQDLFPEFVDSEPLTAVAQPLTPQPDEARIWETLSTASKESDGDRKEWMPPSTAGRGKRRQSSTASSNAVDGERRTSPRKKARS
jgi:hypothetical protein